MEYKLRQIAQTAEVARGRGINREETEMEISIARSVTRKKGAGAILLFILVPVALMGQDGKWHPEITFRPRALVTPSQLPSIIDWAKGDSVARLLHAGLYATAAGSGIDQRSRAQIAKAAAFCLALGFDPSTPSNAPLEQAQKDSLAREVTAALASIDPTVAGATTNYQWHALELQQFCEAYDLLLGCGYPPDSIAERNLAQFASNAYKELGKPFLVKNNLTLKLAAALGTAAVTLNGFTSAAPEFQPAQWIGTAMSFINDVMWNIESSSQTIEGYSEGPYYFRYAMQSLIPFFLAMRNFNGDWTESYRGVSLRSPWFDERYTLLYDWAASLRMPDGRLPAFEDTYMDSYFPELDILAAKGPAYARYAWRCDRNGRPMSAQEYAAQIANLQDLRPQYIAARVRTGREAPPDWSPSRFMPDAGYGILRGDWSDSSAYLALIGKHGRARTGESPVGSGHKQANETAAILASGGNLLLLEPGYYDYDTRDSLVFSRNHNIILVDGKGPDDVSVGTMLFGVDAFIGDTLTSRVCDKTTVRTSYQGAQISRSAYFIDKEFFVIHDRVASSSSRRWTHQLHGAGLLANGTCSHDSLTHTTIWTAEEARLWTLVDGFSDTEPSATQELVTRKHAPRYRTFAEHTALYTSVDGDSARFLSILVPTGKGSAPDIRRASDSLSTTYVLHTGKKTHMIVTTRRGERTECRSDSLSITTDALLLFYSPDQTRASQYSIVAEDAGTIVLNGKSILWTPSRTTAVLDFSGSAIRGAVRGPDLGRIELGTDYMPASISGSHITRWYMTTHKIVLECSGTEADFAVQLSDRPVRAESEAPVPDFPVLEQNYPNPFNPTTTVRFSLPARERVTLEVFNTLGKRIQTVVDREMDPGIHSLTIDAEGWTTGRYFYRLRTSKGIITRSMLVLK